MRLRSHAGFSTCRGGSVPGLSIMGGVTHSRSRFTTDFTDCDEPTVMASLEMMSTVRPVSCCQRSHSGSFFFSDRI